MNWIPVTDALPDTDERVLCEVLEMWPYEARVSVGWVDARGHWNVEAPNGFEFRARVTHWARIVARG